MINIQDLYCQFAFMLFKALCLFIFNLSDPQLRIPQAAFLLMLIKLACLSAY